MAAYHRRIGARRGGGRRCGKMDGCTLAAVEKLRAILLIVCGVMEGDVDADLLYMSFQWFCTAWYALLLV